MAPDFDLLDKKTEPGMPREFPLEDRHRDEVKCYPTLPPEPELRKESSIGGNKMAVEHDGPADFRSKPDKTLYNYAEIPAQGNPVEISGNQVELYKTVLESLDYSTKLEKFTIDSRGDSPELREELGKNYLDNRIILVSGAQLKKPSMLAGNRSYMHRIVDQIQNNANELVKRITPHEALTGKVNILYGSTSVTGLFDPDFRDYTSSNGLLHAVLSLDTLAESVKKINFLNNKIGFITESSLKNLDKGLLDSVLTEIHPLTTKYGSIESIKNLNVIDLPLEEEILYFEHKGRDIFFFNKHTPDLFLVHSGDKTVGHKTPFEVLHCSEKSKMMDLLVKNGFLKIEKENTFNSLEDVAKKLLKDHVQGLTDMTGFHFYKVFKKFKDQPEIAERLKSINWYLLRDACYGNISFESLPLDLKELITSPRDETVESYLKLLNEKTLKS